MRFASISAVVLLLGGLLGCSSSPDKQTEDADAATSPDVLASDVVDLTSSDLHDAPQDVQQETEKEVAEPALPVEPDPVDTPVVDAPFVQEINHTWNTQPEGLGALVALAAPVAAMTGDKTPLLVGPDGPYRPVSDQAVELVNLPDGMAPIADAQALGDFVLLATAQGIVPMDADFTLGTPVVPEGDFLRFCPAQTGALVVTTTGLYRYGDGELTLLVSAPDVRAAAQTDDTLLVATETSLDIYALDALGEPPAASQPLAVGIPVALLIDRSLPQSMDALVIGDTGLQGFLRSGEDWDAVEEPLFAEGRVPLTDARNAVPDPTNGGFAVAAEGGIYRVVVGQYGPEYRTYVPDRWLPSPDVRDVLMPEDAPGILYGATAGGLGWVGTTQWTIEEKMAPMVATIVDHHDRDGAIADCRMTEPGDPSSCIPWDSDNDGGWTCYWVLGECFRYLVTGDAEAKAHFDRSLERMLSLRTLTGTEHFLARSVIRIEGCQLDDCDDPDDGEWFKSPDGEWWVKADTSNDEVTSHMFMMGMAHDLCADDDQKAAIVAHVDGIVGGLVDHDYKLIDPQDDKPTSYGHFGPDYCNDWVEGMLADGGRRSAQLLGALNLAWYLTGKAKYLEAKDSLVNEFHYGENIANLGDIDVYPLCAGNGDCDELAMQAFVPLLRYEPDPALRAQWRTGWNQLYETLHTQEDAVWDLTNALFGGETIDLSRVARWFQGYPTDLIRWTIHNDARQDAIAPPAYYLNKDPQANYRMRSDGHIFPADERPCERHNTPQFRFLGGHGPKREMDSADVLFAYWMARYYGFLAGAEE